MSGIYIHIPFCRKACHYCNFHFSTTLRLKEELVMALCKELAMRAHELPAQPLRSIYFGGGTPSLLSEAELLELFQTLRTHFEVAPDAEITLEANPDDLNADYLRLLHRVGINRLSIGVQSFFDEDLHWMNRVHSANTAEQAIRTAQEVGFSNITIDLIYGVPSLSNTRWEANIHKALQLGIDHISSYCLTVEQHTALAHYIQEGRYPQPDEEQGAQQFELLIRLLEEHKFEQYEISNFARNGKYAVHNSNYWKGLPYLGIGPSAHSFNTRERSWNVANNVAYIKAINANELPITTEVLSREDRFNEYVMTGLRTIWGCDLNYMQQEFPDFMKHISQQLQVKQDAGLILIHNDRMRLTRQSRFLADGIAADLFVQA